MVSSVQSEETDREFLVYSAKIAEQAERYDEMSDFMHKVVELGKELSVEERNLLSVAYKNSVGSRRASWRIITSVEAKQMAKHNERESKIASAYRMKIEEELGSICKDILDLLDKYLIDSATSAESRVFYYKMKGDYYRYISEFSAEQKKVEPTEKAKNAYEEATSIARAQLPTTHPIRLGLALNFSVFFYEIVGEPAGACEMARQAFDDAISELDNVSEESYRDSTLIMQLLRDNLTLWTADSVAGEKDSAVQQPGTSGVPSAEAGGAAAAPPVSGSKEEGS